MIYAGKEIKTIFIGNRVLTSAYAGSVNVYVSAKPFSDCTWAEIKEIADAGLASQYFALGDTKTDTDANNVVHTYRIVQFGYGGNALMLEDLNPLQGGAMLNPFTNVDADGAYDNYSISSMRTTTLPAVLLTYPSALQAAIGQTSYKVATNANNGTILTLTDKLFLGAAKEYAGGNAYARAEENDALTQFALYAANNTDAFRIKKNSSDVSSEYWTRSPKSGNIVNVATISASGNVYSNNTEASLNFSPLFTIGDYATRTIPYIGNSTLTASYVNTWASKIQASVRAGCVKVIVPVEFTDYESGSLDAIFAAFQNMETIQSPWLNGTKTDGMEWIVKGSGTLTANYLQSVINGDTAIATYVNKIVIPVEFTDYEANVFNSLDSLSNDFGVVVPFHIGNYAKSCYTGAKMKTLWYKGALSADSIEQMNSIETLYIEGATTSFVYGIWSCAKLKNVYLNTVITMNNGGIGGNGMLALKNIYAPVVQTFGDFSFANADPNLWIGRDDCSLSAPIDVNKIYAPATSVGTYMVATNWANYANRFIGVIDGASIYQNMEGEQGVSMNYPTLSSSLTIDSSGHLIENSTDLFDGYTATWYSDEDCTTVISDPTTIAATDTAYVKLTAI